MGLITCKSLKEEADFYIRRRPINALIKVTVQPGTARIADLRDLDLRANGIYA